MKVKKLFFQFFLVFSVSLLNAQVMISDREDTISSKKVLLELKSSNKALYLTRVNNVADIKFPERGMITYDNSKGCIRLYYETGWSGCFLSSLASDVIITRIQDFNLNNLGEDFIDLPNSGFSVSDIINYNYIDINASLSHIYYLEGTGCGSYEVRLVAQQEEGAEEVLETITLLGRSTSFDISDSTQDFYTIHSLYRVNGTIDSPLTVNFKLQVRNIDPNCNYFMEIDNEESTRHRLTGEMEHYVVSSI